MDYKRLNDESTELILEWLELRKQPASFIKEQKQVPDVVGALTEKEDIDVLVYKFRSALMDNKLVEAEELLESLHQKIKNYGDRVLIGILKRDTPRK